MSVRERLLWMVSSLPLSLATSIPILVYGSQMSSTHKWIWCIGTIAVAWHSYFYGRREMRKAVQP